MVLPLRLQPAVMQTAYGVIVDVFPAVRVTVNVQADPSALGALMSTSKRTVRSLDDQPPPTALPDVHDVLNERVGLPLLTACASPVTIS
jgi:hypothetical protein